MSPAGHFGVPVALIIGVEATGMSTASARQESSTGACYNRRRISKLGDGAASAKIGHYFHRYSQGKKVKSFVPGSEWPQNGGPGK
jgi:hypothetical protein